MNGCTKYMSQPSSVRADATGGAMQMFPEIRRVCGRRLALSKLAYWGHALPEYQPSLHKNNVVIEPTPEKPLQCSPSKTHRVPGAAPEFRCPKRLIESPRILVTLGVKMRRHMLRKDYQNRLQLLVPIHTCVIPPPGVDELAQVVYGRGYVYSIQYHVVWCVKYRRKIITPVVERTLGSIIRKIAAQNDFSLE
jgi:hypothetical protein